MKRKQEGKGKFQIWAIALIAIVLSWLYFTTSNFETGTVKIILKAFGIEFSAEVDKQQSPQQLLPPKNLNTTIK